jgi:hypothetical protein
VKRSGRDEPMWVAVHKYIEVKLGIFLKNYLYLKLEKTLGLSYCLLSFLLNKISKQEGGMGSAWKQGEEVGQGGRGRPKMYTHVSKCKNDKRKEGQKQLLCIMSFSHFSVHLFIHSFTKQE